MAGCLSRMSGGLFRCRSLLGMPSQKNIEYDGAVLRHWWASGLEAFLYQLQRLHLRSRLWTTIPSSSIRWLDFLLYPPSVSRQPRSFLLSAPAFTNSLVHQPKDTLLPLPGFVLHPRPGSFPVHQPHLPSVSHAAYGSRPAKCAKEPAALVLPASAILPLQHTLGPTWADVAGCLIANPAGSSFLTPRACRSCFNVVL